MIHFYAYFSNLVVEKESKVRIPRCTISNKKRTKGKNTEAGGGGGREGKKGWNAEGIRPRRKKGEMIKTAKGNDRRATDERA